MIVPKKNLLISSSILCAAVLLSGCTFKPPEPTDVELSNIKVTDTQTGTGGMGEQAQQEQTKPQQTTLPQKGKTDMPMKQLADFAPIVGTEVTLKTSKGDIVFTLFRDKAPLTTLNFLTLAQSGFYDGMVFHRVIADFMAQVGDPKTKDPALQAEWGTGGPGYVIPDEFDPTLKHDTEGVVSMANAGANTGGSQFFITYAPTSWLDGKHAVFGKVTTGMDVLKKITVGDTITSVSIK